MPLTGGVVEARQGPIRAMVVAEREMSLNMMGWVGSAGVCGPESRKRFSIYFVMDLCVERGAGL